MEACLPKSEKERLAAIEPYQILDTLPEGQFDEITQVPAHICGCLIADQDRDGTANPRCCLRARLTDGAPGPNTTLR
jgi:hypothetical protein